MPCKYVIHTVGPIYGLDDDYNEKYLYNAYYNSLKLASEYNLRSISFPSISTDSYGYPIEKAVGVVFRVVKDFIDNEGNIDEIVFVLFNDKDYTTYSDYFQSRLNLG